MGKLIVDWNKETVRRDGYFQALLDVKNWFSKHSITLKNSKMYNQKGITLLLSALVDYSDYMFEMGEDMDLYYDIAQKKMFVLEEKK